MKAFKAAIVIIGLTAGSAIANDFSFTGNFKNDNEVQPFFFSVTEPKADVTLKTLSYSGGINAAGAVIPRGGFDPIISIFDAISGLRINFADDGGADYNSFDSYLVQNLNAGNYFALLTDYLNLSVGSYLTDGFDGASTPNLGGLESRWAVDILNASTASVGVPYISPIPEPATSAMLIAGLGLLGWKLRRA